LIDLLHSPFMGHAFWMWLAFATVVMALLAFDLGVLHARDREIGVRESLALSAGYVTVAVLFGGSGASWASSAASSTSPAS